MPIFLHIIEILSMLCHFLPEMIPLEQYLELTFTLSCQMIIPWDGLEFL